MKTPLRLPALALCAALLGTGCATVTHGPSQKVAFESEPSGAVVLVDGVPLGQTPTEISLRRGNIYEISLEKPAYKPHTETIEPVWNDVRLRQVRFGIDELINADTDLRPDAVFARLERDPDADAVVVGEMAERILLLDDKLYRGAITRGQHERAMAQLLERYGR